MKILNLTKEIKIYRDKIEFDNKKLLPEIDLNLQINHKTAIYEPNHPGIQSSIILSGGHIEKLLNQITFKIKKQFNISETDVYILDCWIFQSKNDNDLSLYHNHLNNIAKKLIGGIVNEWTFTYYVQMPNNLNKNEGKLYFKPNEVSNEISILPEEGDLFIFPAFLNHRPGINTNSTIDRIVIAGNFVKMDVNTKFRKLEKTLF